MPGRPLSPFLTPSKRIRIINPIADVAELADAQVSEACDGDIVEVQVLSSAPVVFDEPFLIGSFFIGLNSKEATRAVVTPLKNFATEPTGSVFSH